MSLVLLFFNQPAAALDVSSLPALYGSYFYHHWFEDYDASRTNAWVDSINGLDASQATANRRPTSTLTAVNRIAPSFDVVAGQEDRLATTNVTPPAGTTSAQIGLAFYAPSTSGQFTYFLDALFGSALVYVDTDNKYYFAFDTALIDITSYLTLDAWNALVIDLRGDDAATNPFRLYTQNGLAYSHTSPLSFPDFTTSIDRYAFGDTSATVATKLCSAFVAYRSSNFPVDTYATAAAQILYSYVFSFAWLGGVVATPFPTARRWQYASEYDAAFVAQITSVPDVSPVEMPAHLLRLPTRQGLSPAFAANVAPERTIPATDVQWPDFARRPWFSATNQLAATEQTPQPERTSPLASVVHPDRVTRPFYEAFRQPFALSIYPQPERNAPVSDVEWPDRVVRPFVLAGLQLAATELPPAPERTSPLEAVSWPDFVRRPFLAAASQLAVTEQTPQPERTSPLAAVIFPDRAPRPLFGTWLAQTAIDSNWPVPAPTVGYTEFPASARRPFYAVALQHPATTEPSTPPVTVIAPTEGYAVFPDFAKRPFFGAWQQLPATEETPAPERTSPLAWVSFADRVIRPTFLTADQHAFSDATFAPTPYLNATGLTIFPDGVVRPKYATAEQLAYGDPTQAVLVIPYVQQVSLTGHPDRVVRPAYSAAEQLAYGDPTAKEVLPTFTQQVGLVSYPDRIVRPLVPPTEQPYSSAANLRPERTLTSFDVSFPDAVRRPFVPASSQPFVSAANIRPERTVVSFDVLFPDAVRRPTFPATEQLAVTELSPAPERTIVSFDVWYPASVRRPALLPALQLAATEETPSPVALLAPKPFAVEFPASVRRPALHASQQLDSVMPWARAVQAAVPVPYSTTSYPDYIWRAWSPTNHPALSSGIAVFHIASAPSSKGRGSIAINTTSARIVLSNGVVRIRTSDGKANE